MRYHVIENEEQKAVFDYETDAQVFALGLADDLKADGFSYHDGFNHGGYQLRKYARGHRKVWIEIRPKEDE